MTRTQSPLDSLVESLEPSIAARLLADSLALEPPVPERSVFVNRNLRLESIKAVGFDLDWTLADYERTPMERLTLELAIDRLVERYGYPKSIRKIEYRPDFLSRGLMIDRQEGTVLKMNRHRFVGQAFLGRRRLGAGELKSLYRSQVLRPASSRFYHVDTLFELPELNLFAELVELRNRGVLADISYTRLHDDVREAVDSLHAEGPLKERILEDLDSYLKRDPEIALALQRLALGGRKLFLLTNSDWHYADALCTHLFDDILPGIESWRQLFDLVLVSARKPGFLRHTTPYNVIDRGEVGDEVSRPEWGGVYSGGSLVGLMDLLNVPEEQVLYVGDHIYGDIVSSKLESTWRTALIVPELEHELRTVAARGDDLERLQTERRTLSEVGHTMDQLDDVRRLLRALRARGESISDEILEEVKRRFDQKAAAHRRARQAFAGIQTGLEAEFNPCWGSLFTQRGSKTRFASQAETYACIYTSRVANFASYGSNHYYRVLEDPPVHEILEE